MLERIKTKLSLHAICELVFLVAAFCYVAYCILRTTTFQIVYDLQFETNILNVIGVLAVAKSVVLLATNKTDRKRNAILCVCALVVGVVYYQVFLSDNYSFLQFLAVIPLGMVGTDYRKVLKLYVVLTLCLVGSAVFAALSGITTNLVYLNDGYIRSSFGIGFPTDYASYFVFALIAAWIGWKKVSDGPFVVLGLLSLANALVLARSRTSVVCSALFVVVVLCHWFVHAHPNITVRYKRVTSCWSWIVSLAFPLFCAFSLGVVFLYAKGFGLAGRLDGLFSGRFKLAYNAYKLHGLSLFGTPFDQIGAGGSTFARQEYNFVDNSYWLILLRYGLVLLMVLCVLWVLMARKGVVLGDWRLALGLAIVAFHSISEHHFTEINYNILLVLPFSVLGSYLPTGKHIASGGEHAKHKIPDPPRVRMACFGIFAVLVTGLSLLVVPQLLTLLRTVWEVIDHNVPDERIPFVCAAFAGCIGVVSLGLLSLYRIVFCMATHKKIQYAYVVCIACNAVLAIVGALWCNSVIGRHAQEYDSVLAADEKAIRAVQGANAQSGGRIYSTELPALYDRAYGGFSSSFYYGDDLARLDNLTVIVSNDRESQCFLGRGFLYAQISDGHSLYSNDMAAIESLEAAGYHLTGYYSTAHYVDLAQEGVHNELQRMQDGSLLLEGAEHSLRYGTGENLRAGVYTITYKLSIPLDKDVAQANKNDELGYLLVSSGWGENILKKVPVTRGMFDDSGSYTAKILCSMGDSRAVELRAFMYDGYSMYVHEISYQKTPKFDTHVLYDNKHRKVREMYYDLEGNPHKAAKGYYGCAYEYGIDGNVSRVTYLDEHSNPVLTAEGYASVRGSYDAFNRITREEYFDAEGSPITLPSGFAAVEYTYDKAGNCVEERHLGVGGKAVMLQGGYSTVRQAYDGKKRVVREDYYDADNRPCTITAGYAAITHEYDTANNDVRQRYYDVEGNPTNNTTGYAELRRAFDENKRIVHEAYYMPNGNPAVLKAGYSAMSYKYDVSGNCTDEYYLDANDNPALVWDAFAHAHNEFNDKHQAIRTTYFGLDDKPIMRSEGYAILEREYDSRGDAVVLRYFDVDGAPTMRADGFSEVHRTYDARHQVTRDEYYDLDGNLCECTGGYAVQEYEYDGSGVQVGTIKYDKDGNKVAK